MLVIGLLLFATAAASAIILIVQNRGSVVQVRALGHSWTGHLYWLLVAGLIIALVGVLGLALFAWKRRPGPSVTASAGYTAGRECAAERAGPRPRPVVLLCRRRPG